MSASVALLGRSSGGSGCGDGAARVSSIPDREQLRRDLSDAPSAIQSDAAVLGLDALAGSLAVLGESYAFHGRQLLAALEQVPVRYNASIWNPVQGLDKLERSVPGRTR